MYIWLTTNVQLYTMKKTLLLPAVALMSCASVQAQTIVGTAPTMKNAIIEEFTGVNCGNCPQGHTEVDNILSANAGRAFAVAYSPSNSSYTGTSSGGTDFRRNYLDAFYTGSYCSPSSGSRFMPSAFINRKIGSNGDILQSRTIWSSMVDDVLEELSPMNVGLSSTYDANAQTLTIDIEVYYTQDVTDGNSFYVHIYEDGLTSPHQSGSSASASNPYVYSHTFREDLTGQWGDPITGSTTQGSLFTDQIVFDLTTAEDPIDVSNAHIIAFVIEDNSTEVYTGVAVDADGGVGATDVVGIEDVATMDASIYPNPVNGELNIDLPEASTSDVNVSVLGIDGKQVATAVINAGEVKEVLDVDALGMSAGVYFVHLSSDNQRRVEKIVVE